MKSELIEKYNLLREKYPFKNKYYHLNSIRNFINSYDKINVSNDKIEAFELLQAYLDYATNNEIETNIQCRQAFYLYIQPIGILYKRNMKFIFLIQPSSIILITFIINIFILFFKNDVTYFLILNLIGLIIYILVKSFLKKDNVFCYNF